MMGIETVGVTFYSAIMQKMFSMFWLVFSFKEPDDSKNYFSFH